MVIDTLQLDIIVNNKGTTARINATTNALKNLYNVISDINGAGGVNGAINGGGGGGGSSSGRSARASASNVTSLATNLKKTLNFGSIIAKLYFVRNITKQLGQDLAKVVQYGMDYEETLNLWQTAMRGNLTQARAFVSEMNKAYGISSATLMNYQATFKNMLSALGNISENTAYGLSEALTQMALDFSSLYNVSVEEAMTKFQAVLSGQVRPIRTAGYDITEQTLFQLYQSLGGTKTVRQLNQTEKQLLRILAVYKQMERSGATGDLAKTITSSANQIRIMKEQGREFATWIGVAFNTMLEKSGILIEINGWLYALTALAKQFAIEMGYVEKDYTVDMGFENIENANKEVDELKGKLLGFDKFQVLTSVSSDDTDIEQTLLDEIKAYESLINNKENPAFQRGLELLKQIGVELDENGNIVGGFEQVKEKATQFVKALGGILTFIGLMTKPWLVFVTAVEGAYWTNEDFRNSVNKMLTQLGGAGIKVFEALADLFIEISPYLVEMVEGFTKIVDLLDELGLLDEAIGLVVAGLILWKYHQSAIKIIEFAQQIMATRSAIRLMGSDISGLSVPLLTSGTKINHFANILQTTQAKALLLVAGVQLLVNGFQDISNWGDLSTLEKWSAVLKTVAGAAFLAATAFATMHTSWSMGVAAIAIGVGITAVLASLATAQAAAKDMENSVQMKADGGLATKGSLFYAGEAGPELVTQTSGGGSTIMNMRQLEDAVARGFIRGFASTDNGYEQDDITEVYVDGQRLFNIMRSTAKRNGFDFVKV